MSWKSFACMAALGAITTTAVAQPTIDVVDNGDGTGVVNVITDAAGSLAVELDLTFLGVTLDSAVANFDATLGPFDDENPGDSPFIPGTVTGGDATGLNLGGIDPDTSLASDDLLFAAFGSGDLGIGTVKLLDFTYTGTGTVDANWNVAQGGANNPGTLDAIALDDGGSGPDLLADFNMSGGVNLTDLSILGSGFEPGVAGKVKADGDANGDGFVDLVDLSILGSEFDAASPSAAIPEPTSALLALLGLAAGARRRV